MPTYEIRFLKDDDTYAKVLVEAFADDSAASDFVRQHYRRKMLEIWQGERCVSRRVSGAHDARLKGIYRSSCRYPALSAYSVAGLEKNYGPLAFEDFERLGQAASAMFTSFRLGMAKHPVWIRAQDHPAAPPTVPAIRVSFHPSVRESGQWLGSTVISIFCRSTDEAIVEDILDAAAAAVVAAHRPEAGFKSIDDQLHLQPMWPHGDQLTAHITCRWTIADA
jgi:hypothetical protein